MEPSIRRANENDVPVLSRICFEAFKAIADTHNFPPDFPNADAAAGLIAPLTRHPACYGIVAEIDGRIVGSNFMDERNAIAGIGPITVDPASQNGKIGRRLMEAVLNRAAERGFGGVRLVQAGYHRRSLALYTSLGFDVQEHLSCLQGPPINETIPGQSVRLATVADRDACDRLCRSTHGHDRGAELSDAIRDRTATVVERGGRVTGYASAVGFVGHAVGESNDDLKALIAAAPSFIGPGVLVPSRNGELLRWCLAKGLKITQTLTLMTVGLYADPRNAWLPSVFY